jgi:hypothetical protein
VATNYPGSIDSLTNPSAGDALTSPSHSAQHANANDAIEAIETELGVNPSGSDATVAARLTAIEAGTNLATGAVTSAKIADGTIVNADVSASAAIAVSKLAGHATTTTDNAVVRFDGVAGSQQNSGVVIDDNNRLTVATGATGGYGFISGATHLSGTGTPEGVVTAAPGSTWLQTDATTDVKGWIRWVKATGTGNTGWQAGAEADTGWRDVATDASGLTGSGITAQIRRTGATVAYRLSFAQSGAASGVTVVSAAGFRGTAPTTYVPIYGNNTGAVVGAAEVGSATVKVYTTASGNGGTVSADVMYSTSDAWPSSLPGSAA